MADSDQADDDEIDWDEERSRPRRASREADRPPASGEHRGLPVCGLAAGARCLPKGRCGLVLGGGGGAPALEQAGGGESSSDEGAEGDDEEDGACRPSRRTPRRRGAGRGDVDAAQGADGAQRARSWWPAPTPRAGGAALTSEGTAPARTPPSPARRMTRASSPGARLLVERRVRPARGRDGGRAPQQRHDGGAPPSRAGRADAAPGPAWRGRGVAHLAGQSASAGAVAHEGRRPAGRAGLRPRRRSRANRRRAARELPPTAAAVLRQVESGAGPR